MKKTLLAVTISALMASPYAMANIGSNVEYYYNTDNPLVMPKSGAQTWTRFDKTATDFIINEDNNFIGSHDSSLSDRNGINVKDFYNTGKDITLTITSPKDSQNFGAKTKLSYTTDKDNIDTHGLITLYDNSHLNVFNGDLSSNDGMLITSGKDDKDNTSSFNIDRSNLTVDFTDGVTYDGNKDLNSITVENGGGDTITNSNLTSNVDTSLFANQGIKSSTLIDIKNLGNIDIEKSSITSNGGQTIFTNNGGALTLDKDNIYFDANNKVDNNILADFKNGSNNAIDNTSIIYDNVDGTTSNNKVFNIDSGSDLGIVNSLIKVVGPGNTFDLNNQSTIELADTQINTNDSGNVFNLDNSGATLDHVQIDANNSDSVFNLDNSTANIHNSTFDINGKGKSDKIGINVNDGSTFTVDQDSHINVANGSGDVFNLDNNSTANISDSTITLFNEHATDSIPNKTDFDIFNVNNGSIVNLADTQIDTLGIDSKDSGDIFVFNNRKSDILPHEIANITNGSLIRTNGDVFTFGNGQDNSVVTADVNVDNSYIATSQNLISMTPDTNNRTLNLNATDHSYLSGDTNITAGAGDAIANISLKDSSYDGNITVNGEDAGHSTANVNLDNSNYGGTTSVTGDNGTLAMNLDNNSTWKMTGDSSVSSLNLGKNSVITLSDATNPNWTPQTLTVNGNYTGISQGVNGTKYNGAGTIVFNGKLAGDDSPIDNLHIKGNASGETYVQVHNLGGLGDQTINGIHLITVDGTSGKDVFRQSGEITAGLYDYYLKSNDDGTDWHLDSTTTGPTPGPGHYISPIAGTYAANLQAANTMFAMSHDDRSSGASQVIKDGHGTSMWMRNTGDHNKFDMNDGQNSVSSNRYVLQLGGDVAKWTTDNKGTAVVGLMAGYGDENSNTHNSLTGYGSKGSVTGYTVGTYGTWYQTDVDQPGLYLDGSLQYGWFNNDVSGNNYNATSYKSNGIIASAETGYAILASSWKGNNDVLDNFYVEPQFQVTYMGVKGSNTTDGEGSAIKGDGDNNFQTRLGMKAYLNNYDSMGVGFQPFVEANWIHNTKQYGATDVTNSYTDSMYADNIGEVKAGVKGNINKNFSLYLTAGQQMGTHSYSDTQGSLGVDYKF